MGKRIAPRQSSALLNKERSFEQQSRPPVIQAIVLLWNINQNIVAVHLHREHRELHILVVIVDACLAKIRPLMPRANQLIAVDVALSQWLSGVRTDPFERVQLAAHIADIVPALTY